MQKGRRKRRSVCQETRRGCGLPHGCELLPLLPPAQQGRADCVPGTHTKAPTSTFSYLLRQCEAAVNLQQDAGAKGVLHLGVLHRDVGALHSAVHLVLDELQGQGGQTGDQVRPMG